MQYFILYPVLMGAVLFELEHIGYLHVCACTHKLLHHHTYSHWECHHCIRKQHKAIRTVNLKYVFICSCIYDVIWYRSIKIWPFTLRKVSGVSVLENLEFGCPYKNIGDIYSIGTTIISSELYAGYK